jgi:tellurite resistance protein
VINELLPSEGVPAQGVSTNGILTHLPVGLFGSVMGLTGLSVAWHVAHEHFGGPASISFWIGVIAVVTFAAVAFGYCIKTIAAPKVVATEFRNSRPAFLTNCSQAC